VKKTDNTNYNGQKTKGQKDKQWCTKHYARNKRSSNTKPTENNECSGRLSRSYSTCDTRRVSLIVSYKSLCLCILIYYCKLDQSMVIYRQCQQYFCYIVAVEEIGTPRIIPMTFLKSSTQYIT
jgi:hypothetical protein